MGIITATATGIATVTATDIITAMGIATAKPQALTNLRTHHVAHPGGGG